MENITYYHTPLQKELLISKIRQNPSLKKIFKKKKYITEQVEQELRHRRDGIIENFSTIFILGTQGSFKSSIALTIAKKFDENYNAERISFGYEEFRKKIEESKPKQFFQLDEQVFKHGTGTTRIIQDINNLIETLRKRQNSMIIVSPERKYFDENLFTYTIETIDTSIKATCPHNQELHEPRNCACYEEKTCEIKTCYVRTAVKKEGIYLGFYVIEIDWNNQLWDDYQIKKDRFMEEIVQDKLHNMDYQKIAEDIINDEEFEHYKKTKKSLRLLIEQKKPNLTIGESELICEQIRVIQRKTGG